MDHCDLLRLFSAYNKHLHLFCLLIYYQIISSFTYLSSQRKMLFRYNNTINIV